MPFVHRGPARIDVEQVDGPDDLFDARPLGDAGGGQDHLGVVGEGDDGERVFGFELVDGAEGGVLDAFEAADAGAVFLVHRAADVEDQGEVQGQRLAGAGTGRAGMSLTRA